MTLDQGIRRLRLRRVPADVRRAAVYLETRGKRFLVDFGTQNAIAVALTDWQQRKRKYQRRPF